MTPTEPRERLPALGLDEIVSVALDLARELGLDGLTMRTVAGHFGTTPMALYHHVRDKQTLVDLVVDAVLAQVRVPTQGSWEQRLRTLSLAVADALDRYPGVAARLADTPGLPPNGRRLMEASLSFLLDAGFDETEAGLAYATVHTFMYGRFNVEAAMRGRRAPRSRAPVAAGFPALDLVGPAQANLHGRDFREYGLDTVISGLRNRLAETRARAAGVTPASPSPS
ncbi:TetR/AcrR family transcriptional regulator C-terminal domain-containing protein [Frankia sp. Cas3]|uniref:TetR/AcrR family transcriptional regulator C-terminal domain-containing protein n=1 Tax=Frankia sp. Cas3 TaxID=3073926 RepID=UPI002AD34F81|nr:TetR/AcrR family transcriptional regulator C-terminal domain-containing protein [Frankia sp. Cas3]